MDMSGVRVDDIWEDLDPRSSGRRMKVQAVESHYAVVKHPSGTGITRKIRVDRLKPRGTTRGYRLVERGGVAVLTPAVAA